MPTNPSIQQIMSDMTENGSLISLPTSPGHDGSVNDHVHSTTIRKPCMSPATKSSHHLPSPSPSPSPSAMESHSLAEMSSDAEHLQFTQTEFPRPVDVTMEEGHTITDFDAPMGSPKPPSKVLYPQELQDIPEEDTKTRRRSSTNKTGEDDKVLRLSATELEDLTAAPESLPVTVAHEANDLVNSLPRLSETGRRPSRTEPDANLLPPMLSSRKSSYANDIHSSLARERGLKPPSIPANRPGYSSRAMSTPTHKQCDTSWSTGTRQSSQTARISSDSSRAQPREKLGIAAAAQNDIATSAENIPLPPMSIPAYLQLELASGKPSPLYIYRPASSEYPFESSRIKFERLLNFLLLPFQLEHALWFGALTCLDAWLSTFTILPLRFVKAFSILIRWWLQVLAREAKDITNFIYHGVGRMWHRRRGRSDSVSSAAASRSSSRSSRPTVSTRSSYAASARMTDAAITNGFAINGASEKLRETERKSRSTWGRRHKRTKSQPSLLSSYHKADLLQGLVIIVSSGILMTFDASRMYHSIRAQSAMKLYVLYNLFEVVDRLLAALGQDIFECLTCDETLARGSDGRSKILRPFGMFLLATTYNVIHAAVLFYQVITLNVAVNSYSNALLSLLMSNQFVEIKSTVFKKFEKDNLFQLTCADVVERFQLWLMLVIIGMRNIVEVGGLSLPSTAATAAETLRNVTTPIRSNSIMPNSFKILSVWTGDVLSPFLIVLGSEMLVDWVKHAYISKFNNVKPILYQRYLDVLAKDYYTNAFVNQNLIKRLGLPVIPLSCLFIRASVQTYHMFLATHLPAPIPSTATSLVAESETASSPTAAALEHFDTIIRKALGRSTFGSDDGLLKSWYSVGTDDVIAFVTMLTFFLGVYLVLLVCKLVLGMVLLSFARQRYVSMKEREDLVVDTKGKRLGGWGVVEVDDEKRKWIYEDDPDGAKALRERERKAAEKAAAAEKKGVDFDKVYRYEMSAKRIW